MSDSSQVETAIKQIDFESAGDLAGTETTSAHSTTSDYHRLETEWTLWSYPRVTGNKITALCQQRLAEEGADLKDFSPASAAANLYARDLTVQAHFSTVEEFFQAWEKQEKPSAMPCETNIAIFRGQLKPMWEAYPSGGRFVMRLRRFTSKIAPKGGKNYSKVSLDQKSASTSRIKDSALAAFTDRLWENLVFQMIGETFELPELVGAVCSMRAREIVFSLWVTRAENIALRHRIRDHIKNLIEESACDHIITRPVLVQFNAFQARLREQQRDILAKVTRSKASGRQQGTSTGGSVSTALETVFSAKPCYYLSSLNPQQSSSAAKAETGNILVAADC